MKRLLALVTLGFPWPLRRWILVRVFGYRIHPTARIGLSLMLPRELDMGEGARIGHLNVCKGLDRLVMGAYATIGRGNWITGFPAGHPRHFAHCQGRAPELVLGEHAAVTHRHLLDCTDRITVGAFTTVAGYQSQFLTHSIDVIANRQDAHPITIGERCFVGTNVVVLGGAVLPDRSVLGAKSLLNKAYETPLKVYGGVPARPVADLPETAQYLHRDVGFVW